VALSLVSLAGAVTPEDRAVLDDNERVRADRFAFDRDRSRYVRAHVALRTILARTLGTDARALRFESESDGKPRLSETRGISWSLSHSEDVAVVAVVAGDVEIGVDVEVVHAIAHPELQALAERHFTERERDALFALDREAQLRGFFRCWTRKEACLKAVGAGLLLDTSGFECGIDLDARDVAIEWRSAPRRLRVVSVDLSRQRLHGLLGGVDAQREVELAIAVERTTEAVLDVDVDVDVGVDVASFDASGE
jgi:4'-phosphopantetheinyl transferase